MLMPQLLSCKASSAIIVDSEFTKRELLDVFPSVYYSVHVIHLGVSSLFFKTYKPFEIENFRARYRLEKPTVLYTGSLKPHKNVHMLVSAFARLKHRSEYQLAIAGELITQHRTLWKLIQELGLAGSIVEIGQVSRNDLALAYHAASVVVLPSLYEGFGFSVLEAMASGTPAIGARAGSIPEVMGDGGLLFEPQSMESLTVALENVLENTELRKQLIQRGMKNVARFSWERCAEETLQVYKAVQ